MARITRRRLRGWARVAEAASLLAAASAAQRWIPITRWGRLLGRPGEVPEPWRGRVVTALPGRASSVGEATVSSAVRRGSQRLPWEPSCLAQATAGQLMLRRRGRPGVVVIGLRREEADWDAHAWLLGSRGVLTGGPAARGFTAATVYEVPGALKANDVAL